MNREANNPLFKPLPSSVVNRSGNIVGLPPTDGKKEGTELLKEFVESIIPEGDRSEVKEKLEKTYLLGEKRDRIRPRKSLNKPNTPTKINRGKKCMTAAEKRKLGLLRLKKTNKTFEMFVPIHKLWKSYAETLLGIEHLIKNGWKADYRDKRTSTIQFKLKKLEYYGSILKVTKSRCSEYIGIEGIVIQETKNIFSIIGKDNIVKTVPKLHTEFSFIVEKVGFTILGNHLHQRPVDRAKHNFKKHSLWL